MSTAILQSHSYLVSLPQIVTASSYYGFEGIARALNQIFDEPIKVEEIGFNYETGQYEGLAFRGRSAERIKAKRRKELNALEQAHNAEVDFNVFRGGSSTTDALIDFIEGRTGFTGLRKACSHDSACKKEIKLMQEGFALGTARRAARVFLEEYCTW